MEDKTKVEIATLADLETASKQNINASNKTKAYTPIDEQIIGQVALISNDASAEITDEALKTDNNSAPPPTKGVRITKAGAVYLNDLPKEARQVIKDYNKEQYKILLDAFYEAINETGITQDELNRRIQAKVQSILSSSPDFKIEFTKGGSIDLRSVLKDFRIMYRKAEQVLREKFKTTLKAKINQNPDITLDQVIGIKQRALTAKKPLNGKFSK